MPFVGTAVILCVFVLWPTCQGYVCMTGEREISVEEGQQLSLTCPTPIDGTTYVNWLLHNDGRPSQLIGSCSFLDGCSCTVKPPDCQLTTNGSWTELVVKGNLQATIAGRVECEIGTSTGFTPRSKEFCHIRVTYPADKVTNCHVHWNSSQDWTVSGACDVEKIPPADQNKYTCTWRYKDWNVKYEMPLTSSKGKCSFRGLHLNEDNITGSDLYLYIDRGDGWMLAKTLPIPDVSTSSPSSSDVTKTSEPTKRLTTENNADDENNDDPPVAVIAGAGGAVVILLIVVVVIIVVVVKRRRGSQIQRHRANIGSSADNTDYGRHHDNATSPHQGRPPVVTDRQEVTSSAAPDDDYNTLNFHSGAARQSGRNPEAQYSHIGAMANVNPAGQGRPPVVPNSEASVLNTEEVTSSAAPDDVYNTLNFHSDAARQGP